MRAFIFPGQGSQNVGMGTELSAASVAAREVFEEVDETLSQQLFAIMRDGPEEQLILTENAQPAIMANSIATLRVLEKEFGFSLTDIGASLAGHSLGEYSALCAAGLFTLAQTATLLKLRGQSMQAAVPVGKGAMAALLGADIEKAETLAAVAANGEVCEIANDNDPTQVVISGHKGAVERAINLVKRHGIKRGVSLPVSAPFHCSLMRPAADDMRVVLAETEIQEAQIPVYANVTAARVMRGEEAIDLLVRQITSRVRWRESVLSMRADGVEHFVEPGGKILGPMVARTDRAAAITSLVTMEDIENFAKQC